MLARALPPLEWNPVWPFGIAAESFLLCYAASYNTEPYSGRPFTSLQRAFSMDTVVVIPRGGARPAYSVAFWHNPDTGYRRMTIAIEGAANAAAAMNYSAAGIANPTGLTGSVVKNANDWANEIKAMILDKMSTSWGLLWAASNVDLCVAGYSLGGSVAQVLAGLYKKDKPDRRIKLFTFGCPRVSTAAFQSGNNLPLDRVNFYCDEDPVNQVPLCTDNTVWNAISAPSTPIFAFFAANRPEERLLLNGFPRLERVLNRTPANVYFNATQALTRDNPWYFHQMDAYRLMFSALFLKQNDHMPFRFNYVEFPDDNQWGYSLHLQPCPFTDLHKVAADGPDIVPDLPADQARVLAEPAEGGGMFGGGGGGDDDVAVAEIPIVRVNPSLQPRTRRR